jgi:hypothetical protein
MTGSMHASDCDCSTCYPPGTVRPWRGAPLDISAGASMYGCAPADCFPPFQPFKPFDPPDFLKPPPPPNCGIPGCHVCSGAIRARRDTGDKNG